MPCNTAKPHFGIYSGAPIPVTRSISSTSDLFSPKLSAKLSVSIFVFVFVFKVGKYYINNTVYAKQCRECIVGNMLT